MDKDTYIKGMQSFRKYPDKYRNPYAHGSQAHNDFERGWMQEQKRTPAHLFSPPDKSAFNENSIASEKRLTIAEQKAVDAYRRRKG